MAFAQSLTHERITNQLYTVRGCLSPSYYLEFRGPAKGNFCAKLQMTEKYMLGIKLGYGKIKLK